MATPQRLETVRRIQSIMAISYSGLSAWCLIHPSSVINLSLTAQYAIVNRTTLLLTRCFGAQAMTVGLLLMTADMTEKSFTAFGLAMLPYLSFNLWFTVGPGREMFTPWLYLDFVGNLVFGLGSAYCVKLLREHEEEKVAKST